MAKTLTVRGIDALKPDPTKRLEIPDGGSGLYVLVQPTGRKGFCVRYRNTRGQPRKLTLKLQWPADEKARAGVLAKARELARDALLAVAEGRDPAAEKTEARQQQPETVEAAVGEYIRRYAMRTQRSWQETKRTFERDIIPETKERDPVTWRGRELASITKRDVVRLLDAIEERPAPVLANRVSGHLRRFFRWCIERDLLQASPMVGVRAPAPEKARDRVLSDAELLAFWRAAGRMGSPFGWVFRVMLLTGAREGEVAGMEWGEVDLDAATWTLPAARSKNGRSTTTPLPGEAVTILRQAWAKRSEREKPGPLVFPSRDSEARHVSGFSKAKARLDRRMLRTLQALARKRGDDPAEVTLPPWRLHDLRRSVASGMAGLGIAIHVVERLLNHVSGTFRGIVSVYQRHDYAREKREAVDAWERYILSLAEPAPANVTELRRA